MAEFSEVDETENVNMNDIYWKRLQAAVDNSNLDDLLQLLLDIKDVPNSSDITTTIKQCIVNMMQQEPQPTELSDHGNVTEKQEFYTETDATSSEHAMNLLNKMNGNADSSSGLTSLNPASESEASVFDAFLGTMGPQDEEHQHTIHSVDDVGTMEETTFIMEILPAVVGYVFALSIFTSIYMLIYAVYCML